MRVPICAAFGAERERGRHGHPIRVPPAAMIGTSTFAAISGSRTIDDAPSGFLKPPPSIPSTTSPSTPAAMALSAPRNVGTTWKTVIPALLQLGREHRGIAGGGGDEAHPVVDDEVHDREVTDEQLGDVDAPTAGP